MDEAIKEIEESRIMKNDLFNEVVLGKEVKYEDYKKYMSKEEYEEIVKAATHMADIFEEDWKDE